MGCDIHVCLEYRPRISEYIRETGKWINTRGPWTTADLFRKGTKRDFELFGDEREYIKSDVYSDRNYALFALLADVRNYDMPIKMDSDVVIPGFPHDCCVEIQDEAERWKDDGHTYCHCTLDKLVDWYDKYSVYQPEMESDQFEPGMAGLRTLINAIENQLDRLWIIYESEFNDPTPDTKDKMKDVRVVFWFDS